MSYITAAAASSAAAAAPKLKRQLQQGGEESSSSKPSNRQQDIERAQEMCKDIQSMLPVQQVRNLVDEMIKKNRVPKWSDGTVASADKRMLCRYLKVHLMLTVDEEVTQVRQWCSTLSKESVANLRKLYTEVMPSTNVKASSLTKEKLCQTLSHALVISQNEHIDYNGDDEYEKIIENDDQVDLPEWSKDVVSQQLMVQPVVLPNGQSFDKSTIIGCKKSENPKCPLTREPITRSEPNVFLTQAIEEWLLSNFGVTLDVLHQFRMKKEAEQNASGSAAALQARIVQEQQEQRRGQMASDERLANALQPPTIPQITAAEIEEENYYESQVRSINSDIASMPVASDRASLDALNQVFVTRMTRLRRDVRITSPTILTLIIMQIENVVFRRLLTPRMFRRYNNQYVANSYDIVARFDNRPGVNNGALYQEEFDMATALRETIMSTNPQLRTDFERELARL